MHNLFVFGLYTQFFLACLFTGDLPAGLCLVDISLLAIIQVMLTNVSDPTCVFSSCCSYLYPVLIIDGVFLWLPRLYRQLW
ncbi:hypothetical protein V8C44DRAFT_325879 [Trichoderma aethiopicum]